MTNNTLAEALGLLDEAGKHIENTDVWREIHLKAVKLREHYEASTLRASIDAAAVAWIKPDWQNPENYTGMSPVSTYKHPGWLPLYAHPPVADAAVAGEAYIDTIKESETAPGEWVDISRPAPAEPVGLREFERHPVGAAILKLRHEAAANFTDPQHAGQRGVDWDAGLLAAFHAARHALSTLTRTDEAQS